MSSTTVTLDQRQRSHLRLPRRKAITSCDRDSTHPNLIALCPLTHLPSPNPPTPQFLPSVSSKPSHLGPRPTASSRSARGATFLLKYDLAPRTESLDCPLTCPPKAEGPLDHRTPRRAVGGGRMNIEFTLDQVAVDLEWVVPEPVPDTSHSGRDLASI